MAIDYKNIPYCGDTKMTYLRIMCDKNNIEAKIVSNIGKQDIISCRFKKGLTEFVFEFPSADFFADTHATERRLTMMVCWAFNIRATDDESARMIFQALRTLQEGESNVNASQTPYRCKR